MLILLHLVDADLNDLEYEMPDINFLLNRLNDNLETDQKLLFSLMTALKSLNYYVEPNLWEKFYVQDYINFSGDIHKFNGNINLMLNEAIKNRNLAEVVIITLNNLNSLNKSNLNYYLLYKSVGALYELGLRKYARSYVLELILDIRI